MNKLDAIVNSAKKASLFTGQYFFLKKKQKSQSSKSGYLWTALKTFTQQNKLKSTCL